MADKIGEKSVTALRNWGGAFIFLGFACVAFLRWHHSGWLFFILLFFRELILTALMLIRKPVISRSNTKLEIFAYISTAVPLIYMNPSGPVNHLLTAITCGLFILGFLISTIATIDLWDKFGVSPAARGNRTTSGIYKYLRHPMYAGYAISEFGCVLLNPLNILIYAVSMFGYIFRAKAENKFFEN